MPYRSKRNYESVATVPAPPWALPMANADGSIKKHRLVVAMMAGRLLSPEETVNHIDHDVRNNDPSNLELWPDHASHLRGERGRCEPGTRNRLRIRRTQIQNSDANAGSGDRDD